MIIPLKRMLNVMTMCVALANATAQLPEAKVTVQPQRAAIGDPINVTLTIKAPELARLTIPDPFSSDKDATWTMLKKQQPRDSQLKDALWQREISYDVTTFETGQISLPPFVVSYRPPQGEPTSNTVTASAVAIDSVLPKNTEKLAPKDVKPPVPLPFPRWIIITATAITIALIAVALYWLWSRLRHRVAQIIMPPKRLDEWALDEFEAIERDNLVEHKKIKEYYTRVSDTLRAYLGRLFEFNAMDCTTYELFCKLDDTAVSKPVSERLSGLFDEADLVKFAKYIPEPPICRRSIDQAREIVRMTAHHIRDPQANADSPASIENAGNNGNRKEGLAA
ncbi:MAG: hypothetical protein WCK47_02340 [bacterium]|nr:hypothetical protein [Candidatus Sumerlaeota bacterium]